MEEIEYLEEYEDFILPSGNICTSRISADRTSMDSLDGIYKDLIADPTLAIPEEPPMSQFSVKPNSSADIISPSSKLSVGQLQNSLQSPKSSTSSVTTAYLTTITTIEPQKTPAYKLSTFNRNNSSVLQRSDKLKSVATVKPTLQRISNPAKQTIRSNTPPLKNNTMGLSFQTSTLMSSAAQTVVGSVPKSSTQQSKSVNATVNPFHGSGVDPLSLDDDGFFNFDVEKQGLVDDFEFDSDLDNSIIGGISDLDSVDFSDEFSEGNFDLDSDLSDSSYSKNRVKKKRPQDTSTKNQKNKPGASTAKQEQAKVDQASSIQNKRPQQVKVGAQKPSLSQIIATDKRTDQQELSNKDIEINSHMPESDQPVSNDKLPKLQPQQLSHILPSSNVTAVATNLATATKGTDDTGSPTPKDDLHFLDPDYVPYVKRDNDKTYVNKKRLSNNEHAAITSHSTYEPGSLKSPPPQHNTEHANSRGGSTPEKNVRIKFGSMCLKSIKPPLCKDLIVKKIPDKDFVPAIKRMPQLQTDAPIASEISEITIAPAVKRTPVVALTPGLFERSTPQEDAIIVLPRSDLVLKKITVRDATAVPPPRPDFVLNETPNSDVLIFPDLPHLIITKIPQKDTSSVPQKSDLIAKKTPQKDAPTLAEQRPNLSCASPTSKELLATTEVSVLNDTILQLNASPTCTVNEILFAADSKSDTPNKDLSLQKSTMQQEDNKAAHCKTKELESSEKSIRQSLKGVPDQSGGNKLVSRGAPSQSEVVRDSERVVFSTAASPQTRFRRFTKVNNRWKDSVQKIHQKETKIDNKKTSLLSNKFKPCSFKIRLNKDVVAQFLRSSKVALKSKASTNLMPHTEDTDGMSKPLKIVPHKAAVPVLINPITLTTTEPPARGVEQMSFTELDTTEKDSDKPSTIANEQKETQMKEAATEALRHTSRKRKKTLKANGRAKTLRRSAKDLFETPDTTKDDVSKDRIAVIELSVPDKELAVKQTLSTDAVISSANPTVHPNVATTETEQMETRHHRPNACNTTTIESNVGDVEKAAEQLPSNGAISCAKPTVLPNVTSTETETPHHGPIVRSTTKDSEVGATGKSDDHLPSTDGISSAKAIVRPETEQIETGHRSPKAGSAIKSNIEDTEIPAEQSLANGAVSSVKQSNNISCTETEQLETRHHKPNARSTTNDSSVDTAGTLFDQMPPADAISSVKPTDSPNAATVGIGQMEIRTRRLNVRSTANVANISNKEQSSSNDVKSPAQVSTNGVKHMETRQRRSNARTALNEVSVGDKEKSRSTDVKKPVRVSDRHKEGGIKVRQMEVRSRTRAALDSPVTDLSSVASGRPMTRRTLKEKLASTGKSKTERQLKRISPRPAAVAPKVAISLSRKPDTVVPEPTPPVLTNDVSINENPASASTSRTESAIDPELDLVRPKTERTDDTGIGQGQLESPSSCTFDVHQKNTLSNSASDPQVTIFELPSFIVMKTKIITRRDLRSGRAYIPPLVKQKFNKLAEERNERPVIKTERADFNEVCTEINALLDRNANYLNFATVAERQTRMNQVLADSSLSVEDAQCALKFLRSYLLPPSAKEGRANSKNHLYVPIYDSQRKIIGYRKRISKAKKSIDSNGQPASQRVANSSTRTSSAVTNIDSNRTPHVPAPCETEVFQRLIQFTTKKEPLVMDGNEEIIVPDAAPSSEPCIKNEVDSILS